MIECQHVMVALTLYKCCFLSLPVLIVFAQELPVNGRVGVDPYLMGEGEYRNGCVSF